MKKLLSLFLSVVMLCMLTVPALADMADSQIDEVPDEEQRQAELAEFEEAHPGLIAQFEENAYDYFAKEFRYYDSPEEFMESWGLTEEEFVAQMVVWQIQDVLNEEQHQAELAEFEEAHPGLIAQFEENAYDYFEENFYYYSSPKEYMKAWNMTEEEFVAEMVDYQVQDVLDEEQHQAELAEFEETHPGLIAQFEENAYDYFAKRFYYYESPEEYMEMWGLTEEEFVAEMVDRQIDEVLEEEQRQAELAAFEESHPGLIAQFEANAYNYFEENFYYYGSPEQYMKVWNMTEEEFVAEMVDWQVIDFRAEEERLRAINEKKTELGGVPGQLGVMLNGAYIGFPDAVPQAVNGRIMVPYRALMEALGGEVGYDEATQTVSCTLDGTTLTMKIGESALTITENGESSTLELDCAAYASEGRTYVPVRFISQAFGFDVYWDQDYETAVVIDTQTLAETIDKDFTVVNGLLNRNTGAAPAGNYRANADLTVDVTIFDSMDGDQTGALTCSVDLLASPNGSAGTVSYDMSALLELMGGVELLDSMDEEEQEQLNVLLAGVIQLRQDLENGTLYYYAPALNALLEMAGMDVAEDAWLSISLDDLGTRSTSVDLEPYSTVGGLICLAGIGSEEVYPALYYENAMRYAAAAVLTIGDEQFVPGEEGEKVLSLEWADLNLVMDIVDVSFYDWPKEFAFTLTVRDDGSVEFDFVYRTAEYSYTDAKITVSGSADGEGLTLELEYHEKNQYKITLTLKETVTETEEVPELTPPEGATVIPMDELGNDGEVPELTPPEDAAVIPLDELGDDGV